jgi:hypothetical protein
MSELDKLIKPEVVDDALFNVLQTVAALGEVVSILDIGTSSGEGSAQAFLNGMKINLGAHLYCLEASKPRFAELEKKMAGNPRVHVFNESSVLLTSFPTDTDVIDFYHNHTTALNQFPIDRVLGWLKQDIDYVKNNSMPQEGIRRIKQEYGIKNFDIVLIDGSEFTGMAEFAEVYGARYIILDDINAFKNYSNYNRLLVDKRYELKQSDLTLRNGFAVFELKPVVEEEKVVEESKPETNWWEYQGKPEPKPEQKIEEVIKEKKTRGFKRNR